MRGDEAVLRAVRLEALSEAPEAFGSTYEREVDRSITEWQSWICGGAIFILDRPEGVRGMVAGRADPTDPAVVQLMAMWVHPMIRGSGGAEELVAALLAWARSEGANSVRLNVIGSNHRARRFYERCGFRLTGQEAIRARDGLVELQMVHSLDGGPAAGEAPPL
jgi:ribosomal protein S18 acetylase RimI-like enzyme